MSAFAFVRDHGAIVPMLWSYEVSNAVLVAERRGRLTRGDAARMVELLHALPVEVEEGEPDLRRLTDLAREFDLSTYHACYLDLALTSGWPLATRDSRLKEAALRAGAEVFPA